MHRTPSPLRGSVLARALALVPTLIPGLLADLACAQGVVWGQLVPPASPFGRYQHAMAYDAARARTVVYGGYNNAAGMSDTWEWDGATWHLRASLSPPAIRRWHAMAYDEARQRIVLYGGQSDAGSYPTETWTWDGTTWTSIATPGPGPRWRHAMAYDAARQRVVLFGGGIPGFGGTPWTADTWEWDGALWTQRQPAASPPPRTEHEMSYDAARQRVVLFGGALTGWAFDDQTWEWDGTTWTHANPAVRPASRIEFAMAYDANRQTTVLFGGVSGVTGLNLRDTWEWNGTSWVESTPVVRPSQRSSHTMAYHAASNAVLLFGGGVALADTWSTYLPAVATAFGAGCGSPALGFVPAPAAPPRIGQTARADLVNAPTPLVGVALGYSKQWFGVVPLPMPLDSLGMPGCELLQSTDVLGLGLSPVSASTFAFQLTLPNATALLGKRVFLQGYALAPGANPLEVLASNAIEWLFGNV